MPEAPDVYADQLGINSAYPAPREAEPGRRSFEDERETFNALLPVLWARYPGQYVAIYGGNIIGAGISRHDVTRRFFEEHKSGPVYIGFVGPRRVIRQSSPFRSRSDAKLS